MEPPKVRGRHFPIDQGSEAGIVEWIESQADKRDHVTRADLRHYCQAKYSVSISRGWVDSFILRRRDDLAEIKSMRQEDMRLEIPHVFWNEAICCLREHIEGMKAELAFNLEEVGVFEWEGRRDKKVVIPRTISGQTMHHRASRNVKHISIITCIRAAGESLTPYIVTSQESQSIRRKLMSRGIRLGVDLVFRQQSKSYLNADLFLEYISSIFISCLNEVPDSEQFDACEAIL
jgi:hypothetical protein